MKVLLAVFDLYSQTGGGQTVYRRLISSNPAIDFHYFIIAEAQDQPRPANAHPIPFKDRYFGRPPGADSCSEESVSWLYPDFLRASSIAACVAGRSFDVVEVPDYEQFGSLLGPALRRHGVGFDRLALSMHGSISAAWPLDWGAQVLVFPGLEWRENAQYRAADIRYGISPEYLERWEVLGGRKARLINPFAFVDPPRPVLASPSSGPPDINFVGRTERRKGPDLFINMARWLERASYGKARIIGPESLGPNGLGANYYLGRMIGNREADVEVLPAMSPKALGEVFSRRAVTFLPSRFDSFNLLALESLFKGCPTVVGSGAGVCRFLKGKLPGLPFLEMDFRNPYRSLPDIDSLLRDYSARREQLVAAVAGLSYDPSSPDMAEVYGGAPDKDAQLGRWLADAYGELDRFHARNYRSARAFIASAGVNLVRAYAPAGLRDRVRKLRLILRTNTHQTWVKSKLVDSARIADARWAQQIARSALGVARYQKALAAGENSDKEKGLKIRSLWELAAEFRVDRARLWKEIARLERLRSNDLLAAVYEIRVMRVLGTDRFSDLSRAAQTLTEKGFPREARAALAMYGPAAERVTACAALLDEALKTYRGNPQRGTEYDFVDDRRGASPRRVSIIVSLYNAAAKLPLFLAALRAQTLLKSGQVELIFIDAASPAGDYAVFKEAMRGWDAPAVYARTRQRETIQSAWNRAIELSRAPYLCFLGVDENILPDCLERLAAELDRDPSLDWVQANSLVTQVDADGGWQDDVMMYDRAGYRQDLVYLEKCYLSWVGALYRRSIHERFGYYDPFFGAAGDTEFKLRLLPFIKSKCLAKPLGVFWNYPDERASQSPRAEIEDLRAWYLHRTLAGVRYAFSGRSPKEARLLFHDSIHYRKSFCRHWSTDVEFAGHVAEYLRGEGAPPPSSAEECGWVLETYRSLDLLPGVSTLEQIRAIVRAQGRLWKTPYRIFNDNRHEEHCNVWKSAI